MREPPPPRDLPLYPVVGGLALLAVAVTFADWADVVDTSPLEEDHHIREGQVWRLATTVLPHVDIVHLVFNVYWLWALGSLVEQRFGHARTLALVLLFAVGSSAADYALMHGGVGLSGVGYGLVGFLWVLSRHDEKLRGAVDSQTIMLFVAWFFICIAATAAGVWSVANVAHGAGAVLGVLAGLAVSARALRPVYGVLAALFVLASGAAVYARPYLNLTIERAYDRARLGYDELEKERYDTAIAHYRAAIAWAKDEPEANWWYNLGVAHQGREDYAAARDAFRRAAQIDPSDKDYEQAATAAERRIKFDRVRTFLNDITDRAAGSAATRPAATDPPESTDPD